MKKELIINATPDVVKIALLEDKRLVELHEEKVNSEFAVGDLYLGRIKKVVPGLNAAFVDVGYERDAFLHYLDLGPQLRSLQKFVQYTRKGKSKNSSLAGLNLEKDIDKNGKISDVFSSGQEILVQVAKEPISTKGPRIACEISLAGRFLVLVPFSNKVSVSQRIRSKTEKSRLINLIESIKPKNFGVIIRTVAENKKVAELDQDLKDLVNKWDRMHQAMVSGKLPNRVLGELSRSASILRDLLNPSFNSIVVNDPILFEETKAYLETISPESSSILKLHKTKTPVFDAFGIEKQIKALFGRNVTMPSGAYLVIEHTEALHVIDVNSGNTAKSEDNQESVAMKVNAEAADEIARQLRLRDMGGIIVVDFIDMRKAEHKRELMNQMKDFMKSDKAKHHILPPSKFGLIQITRQRVRPEMAIKTSETIMTINGDQEVRATILLIDDIENKLSKVAKENRDVNIFCHPFIEAYFKKGFASYQRKWFWKYKKWIGVSSSNSLPLMEYHFRNSAGENLLK
ncbi:MAG: Rne/Rng family ribonuclease [Flavobacteriales bacterium]|nr:Rne/Rng family ribonuclease [Flavobacteriales bacterium]